VRALLNGEKMEFSRRQHSWEVSALYSCTLTLTADVRDVGKTCKATE
jgi:hypothetical protein